MNSAGTLNWASFRRQLGGNIHTDLETPPQLGVVRWPSAGDTAGYSQAHSSFFNLDDQGLNWEEGMPPDLRSGTSCLRSTTSNNRSCTSQLISGTFWLGSTTLLAFKHQTLFKCHKSQTECLECSRTPGRRSGTPPLNSVLRTRASTLQAS